MNPCLPAHASHTLLSCPCPVSSPSHNPTRSSLQDAGLAALEKLDAGLLEFQALIDAKDKQAVPIKQREVLEYVGQVEAAMVKGFPFEVPKEYADRPLLKVRLWERAGGLWQRPDRLTGPLAADGVTTLQAATQVCSSCLNSAFVFLPPLPLHPPHTHTPALQPIRVVPPLR